MPGEMTEVPIAQQRGRTEIIQFIPPTTDKVYLLKENHRSASETHWGKMASTEDYQHAMEQWKSHMNRWYDGLADKSKADIQYIFVSAGIPFLTEKDKSGNQIYKLDWGKMTNLEPFVRAVSGAKKDHDINISSARALAGIFGKEVQESLFPRIPSRIEQWKKDEEQSRQVVERAYQKGKIPEDKRNKLIAKVDERAQSHDHVFNGIVFDPTLTREQRDKIQNAMRMLPIDLVRNIARVNLLKKDEFTGAMCYAGSHKVGNGVIGVREDAFPYEADTFNRKLLHEVGGHGLMNMLLVLSPDLHKQLMNNLRDFEKKFPGILNKDSYSKKILAGESSYKTDFEKHAFDEFYADRLAEWFFAKANGRPVSSNRIEAQPFTSQEEAAINALCEQTFSNWQQAVNKSNEPRGEIAKILDRLKKAA